MTLLRSFAAVRPRRLLVRIPMRLYQEPASATDLECRVRIWNTGGYQACDLNPYRLFAPDSTASFPANACSTRALLSARP